MCSSSSATLRRWSSVRTSKYLILSSILLVGLTQIPILIYFVINPQPKRCLNATNLSQKLNATLTIIIWSVIPSSAMLISGFLTIRHIRQSRRRIEIANPNNTNEGQRRAKFIDRQLMQITLVQSILFGLTSAAGAAGGMFFFVNNDSPIKDLVALAKQNLIGSTLSFIGLFSPCISFYLCTLSSQLFRHELAILFHFRK